MNILDYWLMEKFRHKPCCELCKKRGRVDPHHFLSRGMGGGSRLDLAPNLIALCRECHDKVHLGEISRNAIARVISEREGMTEEALLLYLWEMRRLT